MRKLVTIAILCLAGTCLWAQQIPSGTLLPVMLDNTIESDKSKPGDQISAKLRQEVPLPDGGKIKRDTKVLGHVVSANPPAGNQPARLTVQFDHIEIDKRLVPISTGLRAFAAMERVAQARQPYNANGGQGTSAWDLNLVQVGGQAVYTGKQIITYKGQVVGRVPEPGAVLAVPMANPEGGCSGPGSNRAEQAFWVFSTNACGIYGDKDMTMVSGIGGATPGQIVFKSPKRFTLSGGSGWLLQVN